MATHRLGRFLAALLLSVGAAGAADVPVGGRGLTIVARSTTRHTFSFRSAVDPALTAPFPDPTLGAVLVVHVSSGPGQCHAEVALPAGFWSAIGGNGPQRGWRYHDPDGSALGVRVVTIGPRRGGGRITVEAKGAAFPCTLAAPQTPPASVTLRIAGTRYCAAFDTSSVRANTIGRFRAASAPAPAACPDEDVTIASLNVLHGLFCPGPTAGCRRTDRADLLAAFVVARGCPDLLAFQEVSSAAPNNALLQAELETVCPTPFNVVYDNVNPFDDEMIFSRHPVLSHQTLDLFGPLRNVLYARIDHPIGPLDVYVTHLASGGDLANSPCAGAFGQPCPPECIAASATTVRDCQAVQVAGHVEATHDVASPALLVGDFNEVPGSFVYSQFASRGWSDTTLAAGNPECVPATGVGCTSGREDEALTDLEDPALNQTERIDFVWLIPPGAGSTCTAALDGPGDADGDGTATRLFADEPNPFAPACGPSPDAVCWTSDHTGVQADVNCY